MIGFLFIPLVIFVIVAYTQARTLREAALRGACYGSLLGVLMGVRVGFLTGDLGEGVLWGLLNVVCTALVVGLFASLGFLITTALGGKKAARPSEALQDLAARLPALNELGELARSGRLFPHDEYASLDHQQVLAERDRPEWQAEYKRVQNEVTAKQQAIPVPDSLLSLIGRIRQDAFAQGIKATQHANLAEAMANDLGLVALALALGYQDGWLNALWQSYQNGAFPHQALAPRPGDLVISAPPEPAGCASEAGRA